MCKLLRRTSVSENPVDLIYVIISMCVLDYVELNWQENGIRWFYETAYSYGLSSHKIRGYVHQMVAVLIEALAYHCCSYLVNHVSST